MFRWITKVLYILHEETYAEHKTISVSKTEECL